MCGSCVSPARMSPAYGITRPASPLSRRFILFYFLFFFFPCAPSPDRFAFPMHFLSLVCFHRKHLRALSHINVCIGFFFVLIWFGGRRSGVVAYCVYPAISLSRWLHAHLSGPPPAICYFRSCFPLSLWFEEVGSLHSRTLALKPTHTHAQTHTCIHYTRSLAPLLFFILLSAFLFQCGTFVCSSVLPSSPLSSLCSPSARQNILFFCRASWMSVLGGGYVCMCLER